MDILDNDLLKFWATLNSCNVQYIMVGELAVIFHGYKKGLSDDLDLWLNDTTENRKNLRKAFKELDYGDFQSLETMQFLPGWTQFYVGPGIVLDIMTSMKGLEEHSFDTCFQLASSATLQAVSVPFLHINHLLANKRAVARPKDLEDVKELEKIKEERKKLGLD